MVKGIHKYEKPSLTVDVVMFRVRERGIDDKRKVADKVLEVLMIRRKNEPEKDKLALPGGFVAIDEELDDKVKSVMADKAGIKSGYYTEQLETRGGLTRDSRGRVISVSYIGLSHKTKLEYAEIKENNTWIEYEKLMKEGIAFDHKEIIKTAYERIKSKIEYTEIGLELVPEEFTIREIQDVYEIFGYINRNNFRRELKVDIKETGEKTEGAQYRPAKLYRRC